MNRLARTTPVFARRYLGSYPKHEIVNMPALSPTMKAGTISAWLKKPGDQCAPGDTIAEIETDKATISFESQDDFYVAKHLVAAGKEVAVGSPILISVEDAASISAFENFKLESKAPEPASSAAEAPKSPPIVQASAPPQQPASAPVTAPAAPVIAATAATPVTPAAPSVSVSAIYAVSLFKATASSPLANKLAKDQQAYVARYGRCSRSVLKQAKL